MTVESGLVTPSSDPMRLPRFEVPGGGAASLASALDRLFTGPVAAPAAAIAVAPTASQGQAREDLDALDEAWEVNDTLSREDYAARRVVVSARPQFVIIDPSSRCNARCLMCPVSFRAPGDNGEDLTPAMFDRLAPLVPTASHVNLFSSGEPTISRHIVRMIHEVRRLSGRRTKVCMSTNGKRLPEPVIEALIAPKAGLQFSVDGGTREVFEHIRRGIKFDDLLKSLELAQRLKGDRPYLSCRSRRPCRSGTSTTWRTSSISQKNTGSSMSSSMTRIRRCWRKSRFCSTRRTGRPSRRSFRRLTRQASPIRTGCTSED